MGYKQIFCIICSSWTHDFIIEELSETSLKTTDITPETNQEITDIL